MGFYASLSVPRPKLLGNKRAIARKRPTCRNNNRLHFERPLRLHSMMFLRVYMYLICASFIGLFAVLGNAKYHYRPLRASRKMTFLALSLTLTLTSKMVERQQNVMSKHVSSRFDLDLWPTTLTFNPNLAKVKVNLYAKNQGRMSNGSSMRLITDRQTDTTKRIISHASR